MRFLLALLTCLIVTSSAASLAAQSRVKFDRRQHLEAYEEVMFSEFADLYEVAPFTEIEGKLVDQARLRELQAAWMAERERVTTLLEAERADPKRWSLFLLERRLARNEFFQNISWDRLDDVDGFVVYVQKPKKDDPAYAMRVARENTARLLALRKHFDERYAVPAKLVRRDDFGAEVLIVLASLADLGTYVRLSGVSNHYRTWSYYDPKLRAAILFEDPFDKKITAGDKERAAKHAYAHLLMHAYEQEKTNPVQEDWLHEGFASYLADLRHDKETGLLVAPDPPKVGLEKLVAATQSSATVLTHFRRIGDLYQIPTYHHIGARVQLDVKKAGGDPWAVDMQEIYMCYWREALLLVDFLHRGERRRHAFLKLLADELRGEGGAASLARHYPTSSAEELDRQFLEHLYAEHRRLSPKATIADAGIEAVLKQDATLAPVQAAAHPGPIAGGAPHAGATGEPAAPTPVPAFEPAHLMPRDLGPEATLAMALDMARRGRSIGALDVLTAALEGAMEADVHARLERARDQLAAWNRLRAAWFADLAAAGDSYRFEHAGKNVRAKVEKVEDGVVYLAENRSGRTQLVLDSLDALALAKSIGKDADAHVDGWARALPYVLAGEKRADRMLDDADPNQAALAADLAGDLPGLVARGFPLGEMEELSRRSIPRDPAGCEDVLARLAAIVRDHGDAAEVAAMRPELRAYARLALEVVFDLAGAPQLVTGDWEPLPGGRVRLTYDFEDAGQLADFTRDDDYLKGRRHGLGELVGTRSKVLVTQGALVGLGQTVLRHRLGFQAPMSVHYELSFAETEELGSAERWFFLMGICDDGKESYAGGLGRIDLEVIDKREPSVAIAADRLPMYTDATYRMELANDGASVRLKMDDDVMQELPVGSRTSGGLFLLFHSDYLVRIKKLTVVGALDEAKLAEARAAWIDENLEQRGL